MLKGNIIIMYFEKSNYDTNTYLKTENLELTPNTMKITVISLLIVKK